MSAPERIRKLVETFDYNIESYKKGSYNETQVRREFIDPFFEEFGWDITNRQGYAEAYKDVIHEDAIKVGGVTKAPDYCFRIGGVRKFFLEAKKPSVNIKEDIHPAYQLRRYGWSAKLPLSILTDFEEFAVYDCRVKPAKTDKASHSRILYLKYTDYLDKWDEIANIFSREAILKGSFDKYVESKKSKKGTAEVDAAFLSEIERWRDLLAQNIALRNPSLTQRELNYAIQQTIDRIVFLRICEDRGIEKYGRLMALQNGENIYKRLFQHFREADAKYNSGLFHFSREKARENCDELTPNLNIDDKVLKEIFGNLYYPDSPYEFSVLPADILGQIYEKFLGRVIRLTPGHRAVIEEKPEVRKAGGVYYTPTYIVDYIVKQTVGKLVEGRKPGARGGVSSLKILDPACGSGSFLIGAYQFLLDWHLNQYVSDDPEKWAKGKKPVLYQTDKGEWRLTTDERKRILLNNIYGVDIDPQAVEVTKLSLLLKVLEGEDEQTVRRQFAMFQERVLPDLANNIRCGNSLIGSDFYLGQQAKLDEDEIYRVNAFDWDGKDGFPEIMKNGGFDAVIGNPPYIHQRGLLTKNEIYYYKNNNFVSSNFRQNTYTLFVEKGLNLMNKSGYFSYIIPNYFLSTDNDRQFREYIFTQFDTISMFDVKNVFKDATVFCVIPVIKYGNPRNNIQYYERNNDNQISEEMKFRNFSPSSLKDFKLDFNKIHRNTTPLGRFFKTYMGIVPYRKNYGYPQHNEEIIKNKIYNIPNKTKDNDYMYYTASDTGYFYNRPDVEFIRYGKNLAEPRDISVFTGKRIVVQRILNLSPPRLKTTLFEDIAVCNSDLITIKPMEKEWESFIEFAAGVISSRYFGYILVQSNINLRRSVYPKINMKTLLNIEFPNLEIISKEFVENMTNYVNKMIDLNKKLAEAKTPQEKTVIQRQIEATDKQIDQLVYKLYDLTEEEIKIVESEV